MPRSALPPHIDEAHEWAGTDWDNWYQRWMLKIKHWFAFGPRAKERWAKWREMPIVLFALKGPGWFRFEDDFGETSVGSAMHGFIGAGDPEAYLSAIQYWSRWSVQLQWPLFFAVHVYLKRPPLPPYRPADDHGMIYFRIGARRDADKVYWFPSLFIGRTFN